MAHFRRHTRVAHFACESRTRRQIARARSDELNTPLAGARNKSAFDSAGNQVRESLSSRPLFPPPPSAHFSRVFSSRNHVAASAIEAVQSRLSIYNIEPLHAVIKSYILDISRSGCERTVNVKRGDCSPFPPISSPYNISTTDGS